MPDRRDNGPKRRPGGRLLALLALAALGQAAAAGCDAPEELLGVRVGQVSRGTFVVRVQREGDRVVDALLPPEVLRPDEQTYVAGRVDCDGVAYVRLQPEVRLTYLPATQELRLSPVFARLGRREIDLREVLALPNYPVVPSFGIDFGARASATFDLRGQGEGVRAGPAQFYAGVGGARGTLTGYVGALYDRKAGGEARVEPRATAQFEVNPQFAVYAAYHAAPGVAQPEFTPSDFSGVSAVYRRQPEARAPRLALQLENPAVITLYVNNTRIGQFEAPAGEVGLLNVPLAAQARNSVVLLIEDETGVTQKTFDLSQEVSGAGALLASVTVGRGSGGWLGAAAAQYAPTPTFGVQAQVQAASGGALSAAAQVRLRRPALGLTGSLGVQVAREAPTAAGDPPPVQTAVTATADLIRGPLTLAAAAQVPVSALPDSSLSLRATYNANPWYLSAQAGTELRAQAWTLEAGVTRIIGNRGSVNVSAAATPGGWRAQVSTQYVISPRVQVSAGVSAGPGAVSPAASVVYQPSASQVLTVSASRDDVIASYSLNRGVDVGALVSTGGASGQVKGAVTLLEGRPQLAAGLAQRGLLVRTGVPGVGITVNGQPGTVTNARGEALVTRLPAGQTTTLRVNPRDLPLGVSLASPELEVQPAATGLTVVDWRENFKVSTFVRFRWTTTRPAGGADLYLLGERIPLDDEGYGLVPRRDAPVSGELRDPQSGERCPVLVVPAAQEATCTSAPAASTPGEAAGEP